MKKKGKRDVKTIHIIKIQTILIIIISRFISSLNSLNNSAAPPLHIMGNFDLISMTS